MVAGAIPSSLFYPASGMPLALAMFGVSLTLYIVMAVVRMYMYIYIHIYVYTYIRMVRMARSRSAQRSLLARSDFSMRGKKGLLVLLSKQRRSRAGKRTTGLRGMIYPCARSFSRKKNKSGKRGKEGNGAEVEGKEGSAESLTRHAARVRAWRLT